MVPEPKVQDLCRRDIVAIGLHNSVFFIACVFFVMVSVAKEVSWARGESYTYQ